MSEDPDFVQKDHIEHWLASTDYQAFASAFINKSEQIPLGVYFSLANILSRCFEHINDGKSEKVGIEILEGVKEIVHNHIDLSCSVDGKRSKQLAKIGSSNRFVPLEETKEGRLQRLKNRFRKKEELVSEG